MRSHRERSLDRRDRLVGTHGDGDDVGALGLRQLERELEPVLVAGVERTLGGADQPMVGPELRRPLRVRDELREDDDVHGRPAYRAALCTV